MYWPCGRRSLVVKRPVMAIEMGLSHAEFFRTLPSAMGGIPYQIDNRCVLAEQGEKRLRIELGPELQRRIALLSVPYTEVSFSFEGYEQDAIDAFMDYFMSRYQRGGG